MQFIPMVEQGAQEAGGARLPLPEVLYIEPTNRCNSLCTECPRTFGQGVEAPRDLTLEEFDTIIAQAPALRRVVLHGLGEPLLHPHITVMVSRLRARQVEVTFNTNAISLTRRRAAALIAAGLQDLRVSLDGARAATYAAIRGVDRLGVVRRNLNNLRALKAELGVDYPRASRCGLWPCVRTWKSCPNSSHWPPRSAHGRSTCSAWSTSAWARRCGSRPCSAASASANAN